MCCRTLVFSEAIWQYKTVLVSAFAAVVFFVHARSSGAGSPMCGRVVLSVFSAHGHTVYWPGLHTQHL